MNGTLFIRDQQDEIVLVHHLNVHRAADGSPIVAPQVLAYVLDTLALAPAEAHIRWWAGDANEILTIGDTRIWEWDDDVPF